MRLLDQRLHHDAVRDEAERELLPDAPRCLGELLCVEERAPQIREASMSSCCSLHNVAHCRSPGHHVSKFFTEVVQLLPSELMLEACLSLWTEVVKTLFAIMQTHQVEHVLRLSRSEQFPEAVDCSNHVLLRLDDPVFVSHLPAELAPRFRPRGNDLCIDYLHVIQVDIHGAVQITIGEWCAPA